METQCGGLGEIYFIVFIISLLAGIAIGLYISSQISKFIDKNSK